MKKLLSIVALIGVAACVPPPARVDVPRTEALDHSYNVDLPVGWIRHYTQDRVLVASRDGFALQVIRVTHRPLDKAFPRTKKAASEAILPSELAELQIAELKTASAQTAALTVIDNQPVTLDGRDGFRVRVSYYTPRGLEINQVIYGLTEKSDYYYMEYVSPKLYYFDRTFGDFEKVVASFRTAAKAKTASN